MANSVGDELVEVVDGQGVVQRIVTRAEMRHHNLMHRNVAVFVQRTDGRLVVHQRADWKDVYPSHWDVAFGGVPNIGETAEAAAVREVGEESGLAITADDLVDLGARTYANDEVQWYARFFALRTDAEITPVDGEVQRVEAVEVAALATWAGATLVCPDVVPLLPDLQRMLAT